MYFIFPPLSINKAEAAKAVLWMLPGGNSFSSMNIFNSYKNTARDWRNPHTGAFLSPGWHMGQPEGKVWWHRMGCWEPVCCPLAFYLGHNVTD